MFLACASHEQRSSYMETHVGSMITSLFPRRRPRLHTLNICDEPIKKWSGSYNKQTEEERDAAGSKLQQRDLHSHQTLHVGICSCGGKGKKRVK